VICYDALQLQLELRTSSRSVNVVRLIVRRLQIMQHTHTYDIDADSRQTCICSRRDEHGVPG
jgi:hypothetical protein